LPCTSKASIRHIACHPIFGFLNEVFGDDEHLSGDTSQIDSNFGVLGFWDDFDRGKRKS